MKFSFERTNKHRTLLLIFFLMPCKFEVLNWMIIKTSNSNKTNSQHHILPSNQNQIEINPFMCGRYELKTIFNWYAIHCTVRSTYSVHIVYTSKIVYGQFDESQTFPHIVLQYFFFMDVYFVVVKNGKHLMARYLPTHKRPLPATIPINVCFVSACKAFRMHWTLPIQVLNIADTKA